MRVTAIERPPRKRRYNVRIDDARVVPLSRAGLAAARLQFLTVHRLRGVLAGDRTL